MKFISRYLQCLPCMVAFSTLLIFTSCQKEVSESDNPDAGNGTSGVSLEAEIDGKLVVYNQLKATLLRSTPDNLKRPDIFGMAADGKSSIVITLGDTPATGDGSAIKYYVINLFNKDNPATPEDESLDNDDGFITVIERLGNGRVTDVYAQTGNMKATSCDASIKKASGTFPVNATSLISGQIITITEGKFTSIPYTVLN